MLMKEAALNLGLDLTTTSILSDFDRLSSTLFPTAQHRGCYYHCSQAVWQKIQALGRQREYRSEDGILKCFVHKTAAALFK
jgi:hypothetical protein